MQVELLYWEGCPSWPGALEDLRAAMASNGRDPETIVVREVRTEEEAVDEGFRGSPTIRVDGRDVVDPGDAPPALNCRIYHRPDGRISPTPDPEAIQEALSR